MNQSLADKLVTMMTEDQRLLQQLFNSGGCHLQSYHPRMRALNEQNASRLKEIIGTHGWPGMSLVGKDACRTHRGRAAENLGRVRYIALHYLKWLKVMCGDKRRKPRWMRPILSTFSQCESFCVFSL